MKPQLSAITIAAKNHTLLKYFYTEVFGWEVLMENPEIVILKLNQTSLSLCSKKLFEQYTGVKPVNGKSYYFTLSLDWPADVDIQFETLQSRGVIIAKMPERTFWGGYAGFITDPEGNLWEISSGLQS